MQYYIQTFGCQMNENDSMIMRSILKKMDYTETTVLENADIIIVNTCCVRQNAENKAIGFIGNLKKLKAANKSLTIVVSGCMVQKHGTTQELLKKAKHIGVLIGTFALPRLGQYIINYQSNGQVIVDIEENYDNTDAQTENNLAENSFQAKINIIYGCNNFCSYCIIPYVRGRERSRAPHLIMQEVTDLVANGITEIQLLGQNVNSYGKDFADKKWTFNQLLTELDSIEGLRRVRFMTSHPKDIDLDLIKTISNSNKICHHLHLPIQSGNDNQLEAMNRGYISSYYTGLLQFIRHLIPDIAITTDIIIGFPGETDEDFAKTLAYIKECQFDAVYAFLYSKRSGTPAGDMLNQVSEQQKRERMQAFLEMQNEVSLSKNLALIGKRQTVLVEGVSKNNSKNLSGRTDGNKIVVLAADSKIKPGDYIEVEITSAQTWNLEGKYLNHIY